MAGGSAASIDSAMSIASLVGLSAASSAFGCQRVNGEKQVLGRIGRMDCASSSISALVGLDLVRKWAPRVESACTMMKQLVM